MEALDLRSTQGSVLGPLLFLLYINDLPNSVAYSVPLLFADDTKLYRCVHSEVDYNLLQRDLENLSEWTQTWQLRLNLSKCKSLFLGNRLHSHRYRLMDTEIVDSTLEKDLGVLIHRSLKFKHHISGVLQKANVAIAMFTRNFKSRDVAFMVLVWKTYVRPIVEYASVVWNPVSLAQSMDLERVQRRFTKLIWAVRNLPYQDRLKNLGLETLHRRRLIADLVMTFLILHGSCDLDVGEFFTLNQRPSRRHKLCLYIAQLVQGGSTTSAGAEMDE